MRHLADDMLLAYVRQQQRELWPPDLQEHLVLCPVCSRKCAEFKAIGNTLEIWTHPSTSDPRYATVSNRVMRALYEPQGAPKRHIQSDLSRVRVLLPIGVVLVLLCAVLLVGLGVNISAKVARPNKVRLLPTVLGTYTNSRASQTNSNIRGNPNCYIGSGSDDDGICTWHKWLNSHTCAAKGSLYQGEHSLYNGY